MADPARIFKGFAGSRLVYDLVEFKLTLEFNDFSFCLIFSDKIRAPRFEMPALFLLIKTLLVIVRMDRLDRAVFCDVELCELNASLVIASAGELGIVIEEIPFAVNLND